MRAQRGGGSRAWRGPGACGAAGPRGLRRGDQPRRRPRDREGAPRSLLDPRSGGGWRHEHESDALIFELEPAADAVGLRAAKPLPVFPHATGDGVVRAALDAVARMWADGGALRRRAAPLRRIRPAGVARLQAPGVVVGAPALGPWVEPKVTEATVPVLLDHRARGTRRVEAGRLAALAVLAPDLSTTKRGRRPEAGVLFTTPAGAVICGAGTLSVPGGVAPGRGARR